MSCIICKRSPGIFNVYTVYGNANHTVRDGIIQILGVDAESYLCPTDCVCNACMNRLEFLAKQCVQVRRSIFMDRQDCMPIRRSATLTNDDDKEYENGDICRTPTPSLLVLSHSRDYSPTLEEEIQIIERNRSLSRTSSGIGRSVSEANEMAEIFKEKKKKRKKGSYKWTHRKRHGSSSTTSEFNNRRSLQRRISRQTDTPLSDRSYMSCYTLDRERTLLKSDTPRRYTGRRTRSVSREAEREMQYHEQFEHRKYNCSEPGCSLYFENLDVLNQHKIVYHDVLALYYCEECHEKYTTAELLKLHKKIHDVSPFWCPLCFSEMHNQEVLQKHLSEHALYSVRCKYCDKSFLSKALCESHLKSAHTDNKERILYRNKIIMDRIDKDEDDETDEESDNSDSRFRVFMLPFTNVESDSVELDVTSENMRCMNVDFAMGSDPPDEISEVVESETVQVAIEAS